MNVKFLKILLLLVLVCSMLFEISEAGEEERERKKTKSRKRKNGAERKRKKGKKRKQKMVATTEVIDVLDNLATITLAFPTTAIAKVNSTQIFESRVRAAHEETKALTTVAVNTVKTVEAASYSDRRDAGISPEEDDLSTRADYPGISQFTTKLVSQTNLDAALSIIDYLFSHSDYEYYEEENGNSSDYRQTDAPLTPKNNSTREQTTREMDFERDIADRAPASSKDQENEITDNVQELHGTISNRPHDKEHESRDVGTTADTRGSPKYEETVKICKTAQMKDKLRKLKAIGFSVDKLPLYHAQVVTRQVLDATNQTLIKGGWPSIPPCKLLSELKAPKCDVNAIRQTFSERVANGGIPESKRQVLFQPSLTATATVQLINTTLIDLDLKPLPWCIVPEEEIETTADLGDQDTNVQLTDIKDSSNAHKTPTMENLCDLVTIRQQYIDLVQKATIPLNPAIMKPDLSRLEKVQLINETYVKYNLPTIPSDCLIKPNESSNDLPCSLGLDQNNTTQMISFIRDLELAGELAAGTAQRVASGQISAQKLQQLIYDAAVRTGRISDQCGRPPRVEGSSSMKRGLNQLLAMIKAGYLPQDTLKKLAQGEISREWIRANMSKNRAFILSQLPDPFRILIEKKQMPLKIEEAIFSGTHNKSEIARMIMEDDVLVKKLLPTNLLNMLQDRPVPYELKVLMFSGKNKTEIKAQIENDTELLQAMMSPSTYFFYTLFQEQRNRDINVAISIAVIIVLTFVMVSLGCTMTVSEIAQHARKPKGVLIALFAQFVVMPASAFGLTKIFQLDTFSAIAVLICGCCPGGNLSNMLAYAMNGDMNLSILMTTCSSVLGLGLMPLSIYLYSQFIIPLDSGSVVPFDKIVINIACTVLPVGIGIAIRHYRPQWTTAVMRFGAVMLVLCTITVAVLSGIMLGDAFFVYFPAPVLACCAILPAVGYSLGYFFAFLAREKSKTRRTICVETGCQNVQLCSTVLKLAFDPVLVGVLFLMPLVYMAFQTAEAFLMVLFFRLYNRCRSPKKLVEESADSEEKKKLDSTDTEKGEYSKEKEAAADENKANEENKNTSYEAKELLKKDTESDVGEIWPLEGNPTPAYLDSFQAAGSENFV